MRTRPGVRQFERESRRQFGDSPRVVIHEIRMVLARERLSSGASIKEIAADLGYKHPAHFSRAFKEFYGTTPTRMRRRGTCENKGKPDVAVRYENVAKW